MPELRERFPDLPDTPLSSPQSEQRLFAAVDRLLAVQPGLLVLEDLHWADEGTRKLLSYLARLASADTALLVTLRPGDLDEETERLLHDLQREGRAAWLHLGPLSPADVQALVRSVGGAADPALGHRLHVESGGNPLFALELLRARAAGGDPARVPPTLQAQVAHRLGRLPAPARALARAAAIFPVGADLTLLSPVARLPEDEALAALAALLRAGLLQEQGPGAVICFGHDLVRRAVADTLSKSQAQVLHRRAFAQLRDGGAAGRTASLPAAQAERLAQHAALGRLWAEGAYWSLQAAAEARRLCAYRTAMRWLEQALECLSELPASRERRQQALQIRLQLCQMTFIGAPEALERWLTPALAEAAALGHGASRAELEFIQANVLYIRGQYQQVRSILAPLVAYARQAGDTALLARTLRMLCMVMGLQGDYAGGTALLQEAIALQDRVGVHLHLVTVQSSLGLQLALGGDLDGGEALIRALLPRSRELGDGAALAECLAHLAFIAHLRGQWRQVADYAREGMEQARAAGHSGEEYLSGLLIGPALAHLGVGPRAVAAQEETIALAHRLGLQLFLPLAHAGRSEALLVAVGDAAAAAAAARDGLELAEAQGARPEAAWCLCLLAQAVAAQGRRREAVPMLREALQRHESLGLRPSSARCHALLAGLTDGPERAEHLGQARRAFAQMGMQWDLEQLPADADSTSALG